MRERPTNIERLFPDFASLHPGYGLDALWQAA